MRAAVIDADILGDKDLSHFPKAPAGMPYSSIEHSIMMIQAGHVSPISTCRLSAPQPSPSRAPRALCQDVGRSKATP